MLGFDGFGCFVARVLPAHAARVFAADAPATRVLPALATCLPAAGVLVLATCVFAAGVAATAPAVCGLVADEPVLVTCVFAADGRTTYVLVVVVREHAFDGSTCEFVVFRAHLAAFALVLAPEFYARVLPVIFRFASLPNDASVVSFLRSSRAFSNGKHN